MRNFDFPARAVREVDASLAPANRTRGLSPGAWGEQMARIAILDRADMNAEQARVYDAAKASSGLVGGPYYAYIRLPKLFEACQRCGPPGGRAVVPA